MDANVTAALLALLGVLVGLLVSALIQRWTVGAQLKHDALEREKERTHSLKREVFVPAAEALQSIPNILSNVTNESVEIEPLGQQFNKATQSLARVSMVASDKTTEVIGDASRIASTLFMRGILDRIPLDQARSDRDLNFKAVDNFIAEQKSVAELMKQFNLSGSTDNHYFQRLVLQSEHCAKSIDTFMAKAKVSQDKVQEIQPELIRTLLERSIELTEVSARAISKMRAELGLPWDEEKFVRGAIDSLRAAQSTAGTFLEDLKRHAP